MKKIGFVVNIKQDIGLKISDELVKYAGDRSYTPVIGKYISEGHYDCEFIVVLGGDGTMLGAAVACGGRSIPLLGINLGTLGYLTDADAAYALSSFEKALNGDYKTEKRIMIDMTVTNPETGPVTFTALNEACVKSADSQITGLKIYINGEYIDTCRGDGVLVCTPTGSTAYNLSAGGPILKPDGDMMAITPICPHTLYARPIIISSEDSVTVCQSGREGQELIAAADGHSGHKLRAGDEVNIKRSDKNAYIMRTSGMGFYDILRKKMIGGR
jgi:NAD+ kinase